MSCHVPFSSACDKSCKTCSGYGPNKCLTCPAGATPTNGACAQGTKCQDGEYEDTSETPPVCKSKRLETRLLPDLHVMPCAFLFSLRQVVQDLQWLWAQQMPHLPSWCYSHEWRMRSGD